LYSLAQHPEYQAKAQEELDRIIGDRNTDYFDWYVFYLDYLNTSIQNGESRLEGRV
jgi:cytochrome P450